MGESGLLESPTPSPAVEGKIGSLPRRRKIAVAIIKLIAIYTAVVVTLIAATVLFSPSGSREKAILLMAIGLILLWVVLGGLLTLKYRERIRTAILSIRAGWGLKFFLLATLLALIEEAITTSMTNLAPVFGSQIGVAYITASSNYLLVIGFSSVVVFVPEFAGWVFLLKRYDFSPPEVFLLYGLLGTTMEGTINPSSLLGGFWFFVYGLMVYLPAYSIPPGRNAAPPKWYHYVAAYFVPLICAIPVVAADIYLAHLLGIKLWPAH